MEIDCWDGRSGEPLVTHGGTFTTVESFAEVAKAVAECSFVISELPLVLSLECHNSPPQQHRLAKAMINFIGDALLTVRPFLSPWNTPATDIWPVSPSLAVC